MLASLFVSLQGILTKLATVTKSGCGIANSQLLGEERVIVYGKCVCHLKYVLGFLCCQSC